MRGPEVRAAALTLVVVLAAGCAAGGQGGPGGPGGPGGSMAVATPVSGQARPAVQAFAGLIGRGDLSFHVVETVASGGGAAKATLTMDVAGTDVAATIDVPGSKRIELRHVGGLTFARQGKGRWRSGTADERLLDELTDPWLYLCWLDDLEVADPPPESAGGSATPAGGHTLACRRPYDYQSPLMRQQGKVGHIDALTLVLAADGTPVTMEISGSGPTLATDSATFHATMTFSRVGEPIVIEAPKR